MRCEDGLTVAIPNWNHELLLPRSVHSALRAVAVCRERGLPGEVLVVDDCSRDGSPTLLRQLEARYHRDGLRVLPFGQNGGLAAARNQALAHAQYRYIAFMDADNELIPGNAPTFVDALRDTGAAAAYGNLLCRTVTSTAAVHVLSNESVQDKLFDGNYIDAFAMFDRLQLIDTGGYEPSCPGWEDYALWLHLATNGRLIVFVPVAFGYYYVLPESMAPTDHAKQAALHAKTNRMFNQLKARPGLPLNTRRARYHPALGYV